MNQAPLDGNVAAGDLAEVFAFDVTVAVTTCATCHRHPPDGRAPGVRAGARARPALLARATPCKLAGAVPAGRGSTCAASTCSRSRCPASLVHVRERGKLDCSSPRTRHGGMNGVFV